MQSCLNKRAKLHVAIIMDGNGRWARARGRPRGAGHRAGIGAIRRVVEAAPGLGVGAPTLFAFSSHNWRRPPLEVGGLMRLLRAYLRDETDGLARAGVRLSVIGRRDRLPDGLADAIGRAEAATAEGDALHLRVAVDYSSRDAIVAAAARLGKVGATREGMARLIAGAEPDPARDVDLLIRTGGEKRLSDFLLWEAAYAELLFTDRMWPDFGADDLAAALAAFRCRERRFGGLGPAARTAPAPRLTRRVAAPPPVPSRAA